MGGAHMVQPGIAFVLEAVSIDNQRFALPMANEIAFPGARHFSTDRHLIRMRAVEIDGAAVCRRGQCF